MPKGWTDKADGLSIETLWFDPSGEGSLMAKKYDLHDLRPIMCSTGQSGDAMYIVQSGLTFYIWNQLNGDVFSIEGVTSVKQLVQIIKQRGIKGLAMSQLDPTC
jgi:hypothetical protein